MISTGEVTSLANSRPTLDYRPNKFAMIAFFGLLMAGLLFMGYSLFFDISHAFDTPTTIMPYVLLVFALLIALGFEFVNGFHDTANAVATVIYTNSMPAHYAVVWAGFFNFLGVLTSTGLVAFGIIALLPVELILHVGSASGFAMIFALLFAAIIWNLGTWYFGIPASSSHTLVGSIIGVGVGNALLHGRGFTAGVDWAQVQKVGAALLFSPLFGFCLAAILLLIIKQLFKRRPELFEAPKPNTPPPTWVRSILIATCTGVSFFHGSNDGQKGMGLIMLILVGAIPMVYGLNGNLQQQQITDFGQHAKTASLTLQQQTTTPLNKDARLILSDYVKDKKITPEVVPALASTLDTIGTQIQKNDNIKQWDGATVSEMRNQMFLSGETIKNIQKNSPNELNPATTKQLKAVQKDIDSATKFIPTWVKVMTAIALGLGTMIGWKRIVITVGERIGKEHLTYAQGASAELVAMSTIAAADGLGLPVSTTHVLSSGVAGTMVANGSGLQKSTVMSLLSAWVLTLPATMLLSGGLYWLFTVLFVR
ncbi:MULTISPECIES: inorganic phosphate transporter [unclassified Moraxella]|uniref:inorganic phosphate transporter n=1 Tax=unclassified Moraxella TaxID=2685852 RepID=UPI003AF821F5